ncbi:MAG: sugar ABC transporter substrate-binding protein, partial [Bradymonadaceae bacterium]
AGWMWRGLQNRGGIEALREASTAYGYLAPGAVAIVVLVLVPFLVGTGVAFFAHEGGEFTFVGLSNFFSILASTDYPVTDPLSF